MTTVLGRTPVRCGPGLAQSVSQTDHVAILDLLRCDPPPDVLWPAKTLAVAIPSHDINLNAILFTASGKGPHPTIILLHGLPGNEQNLDLAQSLRRAGWNVLTFHYRGSWGTPGDFSFQHCMDDAAAAVAWLTSSPEKQLRVDPNRIVPIGHSMGGYIAAKLAAENESFIGLAMISPASIGSAFGISPLSEAADAVEDNVGNSKGMHILAGTGPTNLALEARRNSDQWRLEALSEKLTSRPVLLITSDDGFAEGTDEFAFVTAQADCLTQVHIPSDHSYSGHRIALQASVLHWLLNL